MLHPVHDGPKAAAQAARQARHTGGAAHVSAHKAPHEPAAAQHNRYCVQFKLSVQGNVFPILMLQFVQPIAPFVAFMHWA
jgi:hypothetical protein